MIDLVNLTTQVIHIFPRQGDTPIHTIQAAGIIPRHKPKEVFLKHMMGFEITTLVLEPNNQIPEEKENTYYIVDYETFMCYPERKDLLVPTDFVYDLGGNCIGCRKFNVRN